MKTATPFCRRMTQAAVPLAILVAAATAAPAYAGGPHFGVSIGFVAPPFIAPPDIGLYAPYFVGRVAVGPRVHFVYRFPVTTPFGVVYRPYAYCDGRLIGLAEGPAYALGPWIGPPVYAERRRDRWYDLDGRHERYDRVRPGRRNWEEHRRSSGRDDD